MEELWISKPNKNIAPPKIGWYSDRKDEEQVISIAMQMGLHMDAFITLADALIKERNLNAHFSFEERGCKMSDF